MYKRIEIKNFRCFRELSIGGLERVNLFAGKNNAGKTALLEAVFLLMGPNNPQLARRLNLFRGIQPSPVRLDAEDLWGWLFLDRDLGETIELNCVNDDGRHEFVSIRLEFAAGPDAAKERIGMARALGVATTELSPSQSVYPRSIASEEAFGGAATTELRAQQLILEYRDDRGHMGISREFVESGGLRPEPASIGPFPIGIYLPTRLPLPSIEFFSRIEAVGRQEEVINALRILEPRLRRLALLVTAGTATIHGDIGIGRLVPIELMGEGMVRLLALTLTIANLPNGVVLVDEIETGLHYSVLTKVWRVVADAARRFNTQIFATTHSWECIRAAQEAFDASGTYDFRLQRLERDGGGNIRAVAFDRETLDTALEAELEVR